MLGMMKVFSLSLFLLLRAVLAVKVLRPEDQVNLDLTENNPELLQCAARSGSNVTIQITNPSQLLVSQDNVFLTLDCSPLLRGIPIDPQMPPRFTWWRRKNSSCVTDDDFIEWTSTTDGRLRIAGEYNSTFLFTPTNTLCGGQSSDGGDYRCMLCLSSSETTTCLSRTTSLLLIGSAPMIQRDKQCVLSNLNQDYTCFVGEQEITIPTTVDPNTGTRLPTIKSFILNCDLVKAIKPSANYTWIKDGEIVINSVQRNAMNRFPLEDAFYMQGNNSLLLLLSTPRSPIIIDGNLRVRVELSLDESIWNLTSILHMFPANTTVDDLRRIILDAFLGNWTCFAENSFGSDSSTSIVSDDCSTDDEGVAVCAFTPLGCECRCPPGYDQNPSGCTDIDECVSDETNSCDNSTEVCVNTEGSYRCKCKTGFVFVEVEDTCADCGFGVGVNNGTIEFDENSDADGSLKVDIRCEEGLEPLQPVLVCKVEDGNVIDKPSTPMCVLQQRDFEFIKFAIAVIMGILFVILCIIFLIITYCHWWCKTKHDYYTEKYERKRRHEESTL